MELFCSGVRAELLLGALERAAGRSEEIASSVAYLQQPLHYEQGGDGADVLMAKDDDKDEQGDHAVMMTWEQPLMEAHANVICTGRGDVLNIGFGLGIVDEVMFHTLIYCLKWSP